VTVWDRFSRGALGSGDELQIGYCDLLVAVNLQVIGREHGGGRDDSSDEIERRCQLERSRAVIWAVTSKTERCGAAMG
jgi:hypothetical protein